MSLEYIRQCDMCTEYKLCDMTYFTERMWFCEACARPAIAATPIIPTKIETSNKPGDIILLGTKDELIDISRTIGVALSVGQAESPLVGRKIIVKVTK